MNQFHEEESMGATQWYHKSILSLDCKYQTESNMTFLRPSNDHVYLKLEFQGKVLQQLKCDRHCKTTLFGLQTTSSSTLSQIMKCIVITTLNISFKQLELVQDIFFLESK